MTSKTGKPLCPGCGMKMRLSGPVEHPRQFSNEPRFVAVYDCRCGWCAPIGKGDTKEEAECDACEKACLRHDGSSARLDKKK